MEIEQQVTIDLLEVPGAPALSSTSDMPVVESKPDATPDSAPAEAEDTQAAADEATTDSESATEPEQEPSANDAPKKAKGVQKRLDELTRQREEAERRARETESRLDRALAALERFSAGGQPAEKSATVAPPEQYDPEPVRPSKSDYQDPDTYEQAIIDYSEQRAQWIARKEVQQAREADLQARQRAEIESAQRAAHDAYMARVETAKQEYSDWKEVAESPDVTVSPVMAIAIRHHPEGHKIQYYLGKNPAEAERIRTLPPPVQLVELGAIVAKVNAPIAPKPPVSQAPRPIKPISAGESSSIKDPASMTMEEYTAFRQGKSAESRARH